jgi:hypothetical protein
MPSPSHSLTAKLTAKWSRTARRSLPFLLSGLTCLLGQPAFVQAGDAAQTASMAPLDRHPPDDPVAAAIAEASRRFGLPTTWIRAVMRAESGGDPRAVSPTGAMGLMQIMPATWEELRVRHALGDDPFDPRDNILGGAGYLRDLLDRYGSPGFLAAYNAGPGRYEERRSGRPLPDETRAYLATLAPRLDGARQHSVGQPVPVGREGATHPPTWTAAPLFVALTDRRPTVNPARFGQPSNGLPAVSATRDPSAIPPQPEGLFVVPSRADLSASRPRALANPGAPPDGTDGQAGGSDGRIRWPRPPDGKIKAGRRDHRKPLAGLAIPRAGRSEWGRFRQISP